MKAKVSLDLATKPCLASTLQKDQWKEKSLFGTCHCLQISIPMNFWRGSSIETLLGPWSNQLKQLHGHPPYALLMWESPKIKEIRCLMDNFWNKVRNFPIEHLSKRMILQSLFLYLKQQSKKADRLFSIWEGGSKDISNQELLKYALLWSQIFLPSSQPAYHEWLPSIQRFWSDLRGLHRLWHEHSMYLQTNCIHYFRELLLRQYSP